MKKLFWHLLTFWLICRGQWVVAQHLPPFTVDRRLNTAYMDSVSALAKKQYRLAIAQPHPAHTDSLRFQALYYLGRMYGWWEGRQDSSLYFSDLLAQQARLHRNIEFEVKAILLSEFYYKDIRADYPQALRLNYQARAVLQRAKQDYQLGWRIDLNLGSLYTISGDHENALKFLNRARALIVKGSGVTPRTTTLYQADIEQKLGAIYDAQSNHAESEKHYLNAEKILEGAGTKTNFGYIYEVLSALYLTMGSYEKSLRYAQKAEALWESIGQPYSIVNNWSILAIGYANTGQHEHALTYAQHVLAYKKPMISARRRAYMALYKVHADRREWQQSLQAYQQYVVLSDSARDAIQDRQLAAFQRKNELELLELRSLQTQLLQTARLQTVQKQAEYDRLLAHTEADALTKKAQLTDQQRLLEQERAQRATNTLLRQQVAQKLDRETFTREAQQQQRIRLFLLTGLVTLCLFTIALAALYQRNQRQKQQIEQLNAGLEQTVLTRTNQLSTANDDLQRANLAIRDSNARIIQAQETERQRIAADLHDDLGGTLATLRRRLDDIRQQLQDQWAAQQLDALEPMIQKSSDDLRRIAHNLMPPEFARLGLHSALEQLVVSQPAQPTRFSFITSGTQHNLPVNTALNVYRIVSEQIQNINKHAQAQRAAVQIIYQADQLSITVEDDGLGSRTVGPANETMGIGVKNSTLRAEYIGATLWRDAGEAGTLVVLDVPYPSSDERSLTQPNSAY